MMFNLEARAAGGYSRHASLYGKEWEKMLDGDGVPLVMDADDVEYCIAESKEFDRADGIGEHTYYRYVWLEGQ